MKIRDNDTLKNYVNSGNKVKYIFFWGHQKSRKGVTKSCFSQWYDVVFEKESIVYRSAEHFMMAEKARLFGDMSIIRRIVSAKNPGEAKKLGREIKNFNEELWLKHRFEIVVEANLLKFEQHEELKDYLLGTKDRILVEASPVDKIWGIGLAGDDDNAENPNKWKGLNLLGYALMEARQRLSDKL